MNGIKVKIIKQLNGRIDVYSEAGVFIESRPATGAIITARNGKVHVIQQNERWLNLEPKNVVSTQVLPSDEVPFLSDAAALADLLKESFFFESVGGGVAYYDIEETFETGPITVMTPVYTYPTIEGQVVSIEVTALARRNATGSTGTTGKWVVFGGNSGGSPVLGPLAVDYASVTYNVAISFSASGSNIIVNAGINGALPIYWTGIIKIKQLNP